MNKIALVVQIFEAEDNLPRYHPDQRTRHTFLLVPFYERKQILTQWLKDDADMGRLGTLMGERVKERNYVLSARMQRRNGGDTRQEFDLISCGLSVSASRLNDFQSRMSKCAD